MARPPVQAPRPAPIQRSAPSPVVRPTPMPAAPRPSPINTRPAPSQNPTPRYAPPTSRQPAPSLRSRPTVTPRPSPTPRYTPTPVAPQPSPTPVAGRSPVTNPVTSPVVVRPQPRPVTPVSPAPIDGGSRITVPPRRRTVPFDDKPTIRDRYRPQPVAPDERNSTRQRRRYERDVDRATPTKPGGVHRGPGDVVSPPTLRPRSPVARPPIAGPSPTRPVTRPVSPGVTPRYRVPGRPTLNPRARPNERLVGNRSGNGSPTARGGRNEAPWTQGRGNRVFHGRNPWGVTASGSRIYGYWGHWGRACSPYGFAWGYVPTWCRWGFYSWPAYCGYYWPRYSWWCGWSTSWTGNYWTGCDPYYVASYRPWYWPASVYAPSSISYAIYDDGAYYGDDDAHVTVRVGDGGDTRIVSTGGAVRVTSGAAAAKPSKETLAERHVTLADGYFREGRYQDAVDCYLRALSYLPDDASIHFALSDALFALGDYHYAAFMIAKALELDPELATVVVDKRTFYDDPEAFAAQLATLERYTEEKPYDAAAHLVLGYNLRFSKDDVGAEKAFARVLEIDKRSDAADLFLAAIRDKAKAPEPAKDDK